MSVKRRIRRTISSTRAAKVLRAAAKEADPVARDMALVALRPPPRGFRQEHREATVKRINPDLLPDEYWSPDMTKIANEAERQGTRRDEPPVIPGVIFELEARVGARR